MIREKVSVDLPAADGIARIYVILLEQCWMRVLYGQGLGIDIRI
jgi:hypothetical protein